MKFRMHAFLPESRANGPGTRAVVWFQGCNLHCPGCFNPDSHDPAVGRAADVDEVVNWIKALDAAGRIEGVTVSGGEPLQQERALMHLLRRLKAETGLGVIVFTGYTRPMVHHVLAQQGVDFEDFAAVVDLLIAGPYLRGQRVAQGLLGSSNKQVVCFTDRYSESDLHAVPEVEIRIASDGTLTTSGIRPPDAGQ
jgi:anaerobic ribonucleoside-triphosphate reductase activating protein